MNAITEEINKAIQDVPNFPKEGVLFKDIMPLFLNPPLFKKIIQHFAEIVSKNKPTHIVGMESRGFLFAVPLAYELGVQFVPARKKGKLPGNVVGHTYQLEYGIDTLEIQKNALHPDGQYLILDDVLATGGTALAVNQLLASQNCSIVGNLFLIEIEFLNGRKKLNDSFSQLKIESCLKY